MAARRIVQLGDPVLRMVSRPVRPEEASSALRDLEDTLAAFRQTHGFGRAISAIQIGMDVRVVYMEIEAMRYGLINPVIVWSSPEKFIVWDDCFSFPDLMVHVKRHRAIRVRYMTRSGEEREFDAEGDISELVQHELDHLDGILAVDRAIDRDSLCTREEWFRRYGPGAQYDNPA